MLRTYFPSFAIPTLQRSSLGSLMGFSQRGFDEIVHTEARTDQMYCEGVHGIEDKDEGGKQIVALESAPSHSLEAYAESSEQNDSSNAIKRPSLMEELRSVSVSKGRVSVEERTVKLTEGLSSVTGMILWMNRRKSRSSRRCNWGDADRSRKCRNNKSVKIWLTRKWCLRRSAPLYVQRCRKSEPRRRILRSS